MKINISGLSTGLHTFEVSTDARALDLPENFTGVVTAHVALEKTSWQIQASIRAAVNAQFECDRCADEYTRLVETTFDVVYSWNESERSDGDDDNYFLMTEGQKSIDVSEPVREYLLLAVPIKNLCRPNCRGLCPVCGANLNERTCTCTTGETDSRWDALQKLASQNE
ncbi:MAG TPA: DUF177 domain-containing protein [Bacteroidota bacterium]|nr:DUF177 domain-containing protein [Bacteroidota bacterium]